MLTSVGMIKSQAVRRLHNKPGSRAAVLWYVTEPGGWDLSSPAVAKN